MLAQSRGANRALVAQAQRLMLLQAVTQSLLDSGLGHARQLHPNPAPGLRIGLGQLFLLR
ncbi:hypothetical protein D3C84_723070 [compost metagenome]